MQVFISISFAVLFYAWNDSNDESSVSTMSIESSTIIIYFASPLHCRFMWMLQRSHHNIDSHITGGVFWNCHVIAYKLLLFSCNSGILAKISRGRLQSMNAPYCVRFESLWWIDFGATCERKQKHSKTFSKQWKINFPGNNKTLRQRQRKEQ